MCLAGVVTAAHAQVTTSALSGRVTDSEGEAIVGAVVGAVHEPSGTTYAAVTNLDGRFSIQGMRVGGPYRVEVSYLGAETAVHTDITLQLGGTYVLDSRLNNASTALEAIVVTATGTKFATEKTGPSTNINNQQMRLLPSINRSIQDIARLSPYANGMSFAGGDGRSSNFTVDGANLNNNFGLSSDLPGGGNPISLDAIEEIQVVIAPFDVRQTNFIGGGVNAITKSGTNQFRGSAYTYYKNQAMRGNHIGDRDFGERAKESNTIYGATLGGPIIRNKLFFFGNIEYEKTPLQVVRWRARKAGEEPDPAAMISRTTEEDLQRFSDHLKNKYGYDPGSYTDFPADESNLKYMLRLDWNIHRNHKFSVRYNHTKNMMWNPTNAASGDINPRPAAVDGRISKSSMSFANSMYSMENIVNSISGELNSRFGSKFSNQLLVTWSDMMDGRNSPSSPFPFIDIMDGDLEGSNPNSPMFYMAAGYELFTWNNGVKNKVTTVTDNFTAYMGRHTLTAGVSWEHQFADNNYMRQGTGYYRYASLSDFLADKAPIDYAITYGTNGASRPANAVDYDQIGFYVQDEWDAADNFKLTVGVRGDIIAFRDNILTNNAVLALDFGGRKIDTGAWPKARPNFSPRAGFTWDINRDRSLVLRGGTGLFMGRLPLVFFTNMPTNGGLTQQTHTVTSFTNPAGQGYVYSQNPALGVFEGGMAVSIEDQLRRLNIDTTVRPEDGRVGAKVAGVEPGFRMPQVWKTALALDWAVPTDFPFTATAEAMFTKNINAVRIDNYAMNSAASDSWQRFTGPDNRLIYPASSDLYYPNYRTGTTTLLTDASMLTNTNKGYGYTLNLTLRAQPVRDLNIMAAYTHTEMKELSGMPGSDATSAWVNIVSVDGPNLATLQRSQYVIPDQVIASLSYTLPDLDWKSSTFSLFYRGYSPYGYSYMYNGDMNGDGVSNDLMYIPGARGEVKFKTQADEDAFFTFMEQDKYLSRHKGGYAEAYSARAPWVHRFDLRFLQDFRIRSGNQTNTIQLSLDVLNVGNMINSKWGVVKNMSGSNEGRILQYAGRDEANSTVPVFEMRKVNGEYPTQTFTRNLNVTQCWSLQIGIRYMFN